jgi:lipoprotein-releasing system ATP-binding protein
MTPQGPIIRVSDLHKRYRDAEGRDLHILRGVSLEVEAGDTVSIMGASGAGKSTFLHLIGALDRPDQGRVEVDGRDLAALDSGQGAAFRNETIGFVFQFHHLLMDFTALENVMMPMWIKAGRTLPLREAARGLLAEVGLADRASHKPAQLSGGEQQRLAIARAIANRPKVLLADEPTGNLDEETGTRVSDLLLRLNREHGLTLVLVTHNAAFAARTNRRHVLELGRLRAAGAPPTHG